MPVDREHRDAMADATASFLRGELDRKAFQTRCEAIQAVRQPVTTQDSFLDDLLAAETMNRTSGYSLSEDQWNSWCRHLAFLRSDLEERAFRRPNHEDTDRPLQILQARWHTLALTVAAGFSYLAGWWIFAAACVISSTLFQISWRRQDAVHAENDRIEIKRLFDFYPFATEEEWSAHRGIVVEYRIPKYDPAIHCKPFSPTRAERFLDRASTVFDYVMFVPFYLGSLFIWPLWLVMMSLCPRGVVPPDQDRP